MRSIDEGWVAGWKADELYPQQSVSKLWVVITALDAVDKGKVSLDDKVALTRREAGVPDGDVGAEERDEGRQRDLQALPSRFEDVAELVHKDEEDEERPALTESGATPAVEPPAAATPAATPPAATPPASERESAEVGSRDAGS